MDNPGLYDYQLPQGNIALYPPEKRGDSRLLTLNRRTGETGHHVFSDLPSLLSPKDALVINETKVIPARLLGKTQTGAEVEILVTRISPDGEAKSLVKGLKKLKPGWVINFGNSVTGEFLRREGDMGVIQFNLKRDELEAWMERKGHMPIPPYIKRPDEKLDRDRYQTVYAKSAGSSAAPTAGLHFTPELLKKLESAGVRILKICLHVGPGTFRPVVVDDLSRHRLDAEYAEVPGDVYDELQKVKSSGGRILAVGTTTTRALETSAIRGAGFAGKTDIFIHPGFKFKMVDALVTNFHLPRSSLLLLACAFAGRDRILRAYDEAVRLGYRFYSYGDAMFLY